MGEVKLENVKVMQEQEFRKDRTVDNEDSLENNGALVHWCFADLK